MEDKQVKRRSSESYSEISGMEEVNLSDDTEHIKEKSIKESDFNAVI